MTHTETPKGIGYCKDCKSIAGHPVGHRVYQRGKGAESGTVLIPYKDGFRRFGSFELLHEEDLKR